VTCVGGEPGAGRHDMCSSPLAAGSSTLFSWMPSGNFWGASSLSDAQRQVRAGISLPSARPASRVLDANSE